MSLEFGELLTRRRMVRSYLPAPVEPGALARVAGAAHRAPTAGNSRAIRLAVVTRRTVRVAIAEAAHEDRWAAQGYERWLSTAPAHLVLGVSVDAYRSRYAEPDKTGSVAPDDWPVPYWWVDAGAALMAVLLAAVEEGLGAGFLGIHAFGDRLAAVPEVAAAFAPDAVRLVGVVTVGTPGPGRPPKSGGRSDPLPDPVRWVR